MALVDSYTLFVPGTGFPTGDFSEMAAETVARSFALGFQIALPVVVVGVLIYLAMGLMSRLMPQRSEEHTSELQSLMRISYAVFCLKKKNKHQQYHTYTL